MNYEEYLKIDFINIGWHKNIFNDNKKLYKIFNLYMHLDEDEWNLVIFFIKKNKMSLGFDGGYNKNFRLYSKNSIEFRKKFEILEHAIPKLSTCILETNIKIEFSLSICRCSHMSFSDNMKIIDRLIAGDYEYIVSKKQYDIIKPFLQE